ncbi:MAG: serine/threonine protein kinase, partial [Planctomycetia bacterium]|nr:serine/threonine protein kinase [Planctomycetia bacterium]
ALKAAGTTDSGCAYLAMEYVDGLDIRRHCRDARLPGHRRLQMLVPVVEALGVAHAHGIVHRDLKPGNILVGPDGRARLIDFGAARVFGGDLQSRHEHTVTGQIIGTLSYLSPEQAAGQSRRADLRSDLYQVGVVAYELLAGRLPYDTQGQTSAELLRTIIAEPALPIDRTSAVPPGHPAVAFFERALAKDPADRFQAASAMAAELSNLAAALTRQRAQAGR